MKILYILPLLVGSFTIIQGGLNHRIAQVIGVTQAVLISSTISTVILIGLYFLVKTHTDLLPSFFELKAPLMSTFKWWYIIPSLAGCAIMLGIPYAMNEFGALTTTILLVAAQVMTSLLWDIFILRHALVPMRIVAACFVLAGVFFSTRK